MMAVTVTKARRQIYQKQAGEPTFIQEVYEVKGLPTSPELSADAVIAQARAASLGTDDELPEENTSRDGLAMRYMRVDQKVTSAAHRRIIVVWGSRAAGGGALPSTKEIRVRTNPDQEITVPYAVLDEPAVGQPYFAIRTARVIRGRSEIQIGNLVDGGSWPLTQIDLVSARNIGKLFDVGGQPAVHTGIQTYRLPNNSLWVWTSYFRTGSVRAYPANFFENDSLAVAALEPLGQYRTPTFSGTSVQVATDIYEPGIDTLGWVS